MGSRPDVPSFLLPDNYTSPLWPSLGSNTQLYLLSDVWLYITLWTLVFTATIYVLVGAWMLAVFGRSKASWVAVPAFVLFGSLTSLVAGAIVGAVLAAVYQSGAISMPTEIAVVWGALIALMLVIGSLNKQTFLI